MSNKSVHNELARIYGNKCMFLASHSDTAHYRAYQGRYTSKELNRLVRNITVHHLQHRSEGGHTDIKNCSLVSELAHRYIHTLPREEEEIINDRIRKYKECRIEFVEELELPITIKFNELSIDKKGKLKRDKNEMAKLRKEWEDR